MDYSSLTQALNTLLPFVSVELGPDFCSALSLPLIAIALNKIIFAYLTLSRANFALIAIVKAQLTWETMNLQEH